MDEHQKSIPSPTTMPVNSKEWRSHINISNFINVYYQYRDVSRLDNKGSILIIGPGQGLEKIIFQWRGYKVDTLDIDASFEPDYVASVHDMRMFENNSYDFVIASHVIEHISPAYLSKALEEIARISKYALIYLPVAGMHMKISFDLGYKNFKFSHVVDIINYFKLPSIYKPNFCEGQHFWELGVSGFRRKNMRIMFNENFLILSEYRNLDWPSSFNYVLKSKKNMDNTD